MRNNGQGSRVPPNLSARDPLPSLVDAINDAKSESMNRIFTTDRNGESMVPTPFIHQYTLENGNSSPEFVRFTTYNVPASEAILSSCHIPFAMILQPFYSHQVPEVNYTEPVRCTRCLAYVNPFVSFLNGGKSFCCNICSMKNTIPDWYFSPLDINGVRHDVSSRPELSIGTVEYCFGECDGKAPRLLFLLDISQSSVSSGLFLAGLQCILSAVQETDFKEMAIIFVDSHLTIMTLKNGPRLLRVADLSDDFMPDFPDIFFDPSGFKQTLTDLFDTVYKAHLEHNDTRCCLESAVPFAVSCMRDYGGVVVSFISDGNATALLKGLKVSPDAFFTGIQRRTAEAGVSFIVATNSRLEDEISFLAKLSSSTFGYLIVDSEPLFSYYSAINSVLYRLRKIQSFETTIRIWSGSVLQVSDERYPAIYCNGSILRLPAIAHDQAFGCSFIYDGSISDGDKVAFQCAIAYKTIKGQKRVRVLNVSLPSTSSPANIFRQIDVHAFLVWCLRKSLSSSHGSLSPTDVMNIRSAQALASYRSLCVGQSRQSQLVLPESMKVLPAYCLAFSRLSTRLSSSKVAFLALTGIGSKNWLHFLFSSSSIEIILNLLYPPLFDIIDLNRQLRLSKDSISSTGIYILGNVPSAIFDYLDSPSKVYMVFGAEVCADSIAQIFGKNICDLYTLYGSVPSLSHGFHHLESFLRFLESRSSFHKSLQLIFLNTEDAFRHIEPYFIEDQSGDMYPSYFDFICKMHHQIIHELKTIEKVENSNILGLFN